MNRKSILSTWQTIVTLIYRSPRSWTGSLFAWIVFMLFIQVQAFLIEAFFDLIGGKVQAGSTVWTIVVLLIVARLGRKLIGYVAQ